MEKLGCDRFYDKVVRLGESQREAWHVVSDCVAVQGIFLAILPGIDLP
jgi:hypothetical protein